MHRIKRRPVVVGFQVLAVNLGRRQLLQQGGALAALSVAGLPLARPSQAAWHSLETDAAVEAALLAERPAFAAVAVNRADTITVPPGYTARTILKWGEPLFDGGPAYRDGGLNTAADQAVQIGETRRRSSRMFRIGLSSSLARCA